MIVSQGGEATPGTEAQGAPGPLQAGGEGSSAESRTPKKGRAAGEQRVCRALAFALAMRVQFSLLET